MTQEMIASGCLDDSKVPMNFDNVHPTLTGGVTEDAKEPEVTEVPN